MNLVEKFNRHESLVAFGTFAINRKQKKYFNILETIWSKLAVIIVTGGDLMSNSNVASRFEEIYRKTEKAVLTFITVKCGRVADINDIFQDTYLELYQIMLKRGVEYITNERALVLKIARQKVSKYYSLMDRLKMFTSISTKDEYGEEVNLTDTEADSFLLEEFVVNQMMLDTVRQLIEKKPEDVKRIFYLYYDVELKISEIANELSMSESSVKNKLYRTLNELKNQLEREVPGNER